MPTYKKIRFVIDGFTPLTIPIGRLAEYLRQFANLVGPNSDVRFLKVGKGSAALENVVPEEKFIETRFRIVSAKVGAGPSEANKAFAGIRELLSEDGKTGRIKEGRHSLLEFPRIEVPQFPPVTEEGTLEGMLIKIGGRDDSVPVHIQDGKNYYNCQTTREKARELAPYLFGKPIRVCGRGRWIRSEIGNWELDRFQINQFEELNDDEIKDVLARMRLAEGSGWDAIADPLAELDRIRRGDNSKVH